MAREKRAASPDLTGSLAWPHTRRRTSPLQPLWPLSGSLDQARAGYLRPLCGFGLAALLPTRRTARCQIRRRSQPMPPRSSLWRKSLSTSLREDSVT